MKWKPTARVRALREAALAAGVPGLRSAEGRLHWLRGWDQAAELPSHIERRAAARAAQLRAATPVISEGELLVGKPCYRELTATEAAELRERERTAPPWPGGQESHMAIDYEKLLRLGLGGIRAEVVERLGMAAGESRSFYRACLTALDGLGAMAANYAAAAGREAGLCPDPERARELRGIAARLERVPQGPARNFRDALQAVHFVTWALEGLYQLGRPDRYLIDFYRADLAAGLLTEEEALEWLDCLAILYNCYVPRGLAAGWMVGGRDAAGRDVSNELTRLCLESIGHVRMIYPGIGFCVHPGTPPELLDLALRQLAAGSSHPALFNDVVITDGLRALGLAPEEACHYIHSTCVEITPATSSAVWVASPYHNLPQLLLDLMEAGEEPESFAALKAGLRERLRAAVRVEAEEQNRIQRLRREQGGDPLVSCFVNDCLERGLDVDWGGARYNWIMPSFVGLANLADSLLAVERLVYREGRLTLDELRAILAADFAGHERLRQEIVNRFPKYGNDDDEADALVREITEWIVAAVGEHETARGDRFVPSLFCWIMHEQLGSVTGATPDGRTAGFPLGDGSGPAQGRERLGPTASLLSSTKWEHRPFIGGVAVNLKFDPDLAGPGAFEALRALAVTYLERGGFELQINVVDRATLLEAQRDPERHRDLVVRVGGYSDYFVHLSPAMQAEVIARTGHRL